MFVVDNYEDLYFVLRNKFNFYILEAFNAILENSLPVVLLLGNKHSVYDFFRIVSILSRICVLMKVWFKIKTSIRYSVLFLLLRYDYQCKITYINRAIIVYKSSNKIINISSIKF